MQSNPRLFESHGHAVREYLPNGMHYFRFRCTAEIEKASPIAGTPGRIREAETKGGDPHAELSRRDFPTIAQRFNVGDQRQIETFQSRRDG